MKKIGIALLAVFGGTLVVTATPEKAHAIPVFARTYGYACSTCHTAYPALNSFGEAFRRAGYHVPGMDESQGAAQKPMPMGTAEDDKQFPNSIWSSWMTQLPFSFAANFDSEYAMPGNGQKGQVTFDGFPSELELFGAGTLGKNIAYMGSIEFGNEEGEVTTEFHRAFLVFSNLLGSSALNLRAGLFDPGVLSFSSHRSILPSDYWLTTRTLAANTWSLEPSQAGVELRGMIVDHIIYSLGVVEGTGMKMDMDMGGGTTAIAENEVNRDKDVYAHLAYETGIGSKGTIQVGGFYYNGFATLKGEDKATYSMTLWDKNDSFSMAGGDVNFSWGDLYLLAALSVQQDERPLPENSDESSWAQNILAEAHYSVLPWLIPVIRYESFLVKGSKADGHFLAGLVGLIRNNIRLTVQTEVARVAKEDNTMEFQDQTIQANLGVAF